MSDTIRVLPHDGPRVESGPVQFGDDWPGVFLRGDNALGYARALREILDGSDEATSHPLTRLKLRGLLIALSACDVTHEGGERP